MPFSSPTNDVSDLTAIWRHKFESIFDMHGVKTGSPEELPGFLEKLRDDRYFAMDFWDIAQSAERRGRMSRAELQQIVVQSVGGPGVQEDGSEVQEFQQELQREFDEKFSQPDMADESEAGSGMGNASLMREEIKEDGSSDGDFRNAAAASVKSDSGHAPYEERSGAFPYSRSRQMDDALARLEINSNALKLQLENIDSRMSRLEPHIEDLSSRIVSSSTRDGAEGEARELGMHDPEAEGVSAGAVEEAPVPDPIVERRGKAQKVIPPDGRSRILAIAPVVLVLMLVGLMVWLWNLPHHSSPQTASSPEPVTAKGTPGAGPMMTSIPAAPPQAATGKDASAGVATASPAKEVTVRPRARSRTPELQDDEDESGPDTSKNQVKPSAVAPDQEQARAATGASVAAANVSGARNERSSVDDDREGGSPRLERRSGNGATEGEEMSHGISVSFGIMATHLIESYPPHYPKLAKLAHIQGPVVLQVFILKDGTVGHVEAVKGHRLLRGAAKNAIKRWRYRPYLVNGHPVDVATIVTMNFRLDD